MSRCAAHLDFDRSEADHRCQADALDDSDYCYLHSKYVAGLCQPDYDLRDASIGGFEAVGIRRVRDRNNHTVWSKEEGL